MNHDQVVLRQTALRQFHRLRSLAVLSGDREMFRFMSDVIKRQGERVSYALNWARRNPLKNRPDNAPFAMPHNHPDNQVSQGVAGGK
jgi:hypothetical protein